MSASTKREPVLRRHPWLVGSLLSLVVFSSIDVTLGFVLGERVPAVGLALPPFPLIHNRAQAESLAWGGECYVCFDAELGWTYAPFASTVDDRYHINGQGVRSLRDYDVAAARGVLRIAAFGDSFVHGSEVDDTEVWSALIEQAHPRVEVLNFGVGGYGTDQSLLRYRRDGRRFAPDVVVIGYMLENMLRNVSVHRPAYQHNSGTPLTKPRFELGPEGELTLIPNPARSLDHLNELIDSRALLPILDVTDHWVRHASAGYHGSPLFASSIARITYAVLHRRFRSTPSLHYANPGGEPFELTRALLSHFHREALANGARRAPVVIFPDRSGLESVLATEKRYWAGLVEALEAEGVEVIDLTAPLLASTAEDALDGLFRISHYSAQGNVVVARALLETLAKRPSRR